MECWVFDCYRERAPGSHLCAVHVQPLPIPPPARTGVTMRRRGEAQAEVVAMLADGRCRTLTDVALRLDVNNSAAYKVLAALVRDGKARKVSLGVYEAAR